MAHVPTLIYHDPIEAPAEPDIRAGLPANFALGANFAPVRNGYAVLVDGQVGVSCRMILCHRGYLLQGKSVPSAVLSIFISRPKQGQGLSSADLTAGRP